MRELTGWKVEEEEVKWKRFRYKRRNKEEEWMRKGSGELRWRLSGGWRWRRRRVDERKSVTGQLGVRVEGREEKKPEYIYHNLLRVNY